MKRLLLLIVLCFHTFAFGDTWNFEGLVINGTINEAEDSINIRGYQQITYMHYASDGSYSGRTVVYPKVYGSLPALAAGMTSFAGVMYMRVLYNDRNGPYLAANGDTFANFCDLPIKVKTMMWDNELKIYRFEYDLPIPEYYFDKDCKPMRREKKAFSGSFEPSDE